MSKQCGICGYVGANGGDRPGELDMFQCHLCGMVYCAKCLVQYADAIEIMGSTRKVKDEEMPILEVLNSCAACKAMTLELWPDEGDDDLEDDPDGWFAESGGTGT